MGRFVGDIDAGDAYAVFVRSPHAHADVTAIEVDQACAAPGVLGVYTADDLIADGLGTIRCAMDPGLFDGLIVPPRYGLAYQRVRFVGEAVAIVIAETLLLARDAAEAVAVSYAALNSATTISAAREAGAPLVWSEAPGNVAYQFRRGDADAVRATINGAPHVARLTLVNNRVVAAPLEPRGARAGYDAARDHMWLELSGQDVHGLRRDLAACFGVQADALDVRCPDVGGGFGLKNVVHPEYVALLWAARRVGRAVRWVAERGEDFLAAVHGRDNVTTGELALDRDGRFLALSVETLGNLGAYVSALGPGASTTAPSTAMGGVYAVPAVAMSVRGVFTHTVPVDAYRGAGKPEANYLMERLIDVAAFEGGWDRIALRRLNVMRDFPYRSAFGIEIDGGAFGANIDAAVTASAGFPVRRAEAESRGMLRGLGIACFLETSRGAPSESGAVRFRDDGTVDLLSGTQSNGQGHETSFVQVASARLGLPPERFRLRQADTAIVRFGSGHGGARSLPMALDALVRALDAAIAAARHEAARLLQAEYVALEDGVFRSADGGTIDWDQVLATVPRGAFDRDGAVEGGAFVFPNGCHIAEIEIDPATGAAVLRRYVAADDYGTLINPVLAEGQVQGGLAQGIGQALMERVCYDKESGQLLTASFADYQIPRATDLPWLTIQFDEQPTRRNTLGTKGAGQAGAIGAPGAVMSAVADALGIAHLDMPATSERIWRALHLRQQRGNVGR